MDSSTFSWLLTLALVTVVAIRLLGRLLPDLRQNPIFRIVLAASAIALTIGLGFFAVLVLALVGMGDFSEF